MSRQPLRNRRAVPRNRRRLSGPSRVEALLAVAEASLGQSTERSHVDRYQVVVHVDAATSANDAPGISVLGDGPPLSVETMRRLTCDSSLVALLEGADRVLGIGRKTRAIPTSLRRALKARDGCCRFPGCTNTRGLNAHHVEHWTRGGPTDLANLMLLCRRHHRLVHEDGWTVDTAGVFRDPFGLRVVPVPFPPRGRVEELRTLNEQLELGPRTGKHGSGERIDLGYVSDALVRVIARRRGTPRPRLVWIFAEHGPKRDCFGPAWIDTHDQNGKVVATEHLADRISNAMRRCSPWNEGSSSTSDRRLTPLSPEVQLTEGFTSSARSLPSSRSMTRLVSDLESSSLTRLTSRRSTAWRSSPFG